MMLNVGIDKKQSEGPLVQYISIIRLIIS